MEQEVPFNSNTISRIAQSCITMFLNLKEGVTHDCASIFDSNGQELLFHNFSQSESLHHY